MNNNLFYIKDQKFRDLYPTQTEDIKFWIERDNLWTTDVEKIATAHYTIGNRLTTTSNSEPTWRYYYVFSKIEDKHLLELLYA